jgi:HK97 family phage prohead protease
MKIEHRHAKLSGVRVGTTENGIHTVTLQPIVPNIVDDYGSVFMPDTFDAALDARFPTLAWTHSWSEPIGRAFAWKADGDLRSIEFRFDDFDDVPTARRAWSQCQPGPNGEPATIDDCSVGFSGTKRREPTDEELERWPGAREIITKADLDEVSLVLRGAVPGAKVLSLRSRDGRVASVAEDAVMDVARKVAAGEMTEVEGKAYLNLIAQDAPAAPPVDTGEVPPDAGDVATVDAAIDDALAAYTDRSR